MFVFVLKTVRKFICIYFYFFINNNYKSNTHTITFYGINDYSGMIKDAIESAMQILKKITCEFYKKSLKEGRKKDKNFRRFLHLSIRSNHDIKYFYVFL